MSGQWHYSQDGAQYGPVDESEIIRLIQSGELPPGTPVCKVGDMTWEPARNHACFQVEIYPKKKRVPAETAGTVPKLTSPKPAATPSRPVANTAPVREKSALPWVVAGVAVIAAIYFANKAPSDIGAQMAGQTVPTNIISHVPTNPPPPPKPQTPEDFKSPKLRVLTNPTNAVVTINGKIALHGTWHSVPVGKTNMVKVNYTATFNRIWATKERDVVLMYNQEETIILGYDYGRVKIKTDPKGATVTFNGVELSQKSPVDLLHVLAREHEVKVKYRNWDDKHKTFVVRKDTNQTIALGYDYGSLNITTVPKGATVTFDGAEKGKSPVAIREYLLTGKYDVEIKYLDWPKKSETNEIVKGLNRWKIEYEMGEVIIRSDPFNQEVRDDRGKLLGKTPHEIGMEPEGKVVKYKVGKKESVYKMEEVEGKVEANKTLELKAQMKLKDAGSIIWVIDAPDAEWLTINPFGLLYISQEKGVDAVDPATGTPIRQLPPMGSMPAFGPNGHLFFTERKMPNKKEDVLIAYDPVNKANIWRRRMEMLTYNAGRYAITYPVVGKGIVYMKGYNKVGKEQQPVLKAFSSFNGKILWSCPTGYRKGSFAPSLSREGHLWDVSNPVTKLDDTFWINRIDGKNGSIQTYIIKGFSSQTSPVFRGFRVTYLTRKEVVVIDLKHKWGKVDFANEPNAWSIKPLLKLPPSSPHNMAIRGNIAYVTWDIPATITAIDLIKNETKWQKALKNGANGVRQSQPIIDRDGTIYVLSDGKVVMLDKDGKELKGSVFLEGAPNAVPRHNIRRLNGDGHITLGRKGLLFVLYAGKTYAIMGNCYLKNGRQPWPMIGANPRRTGAPTE